MKGDRMVPTLQKRRANRNGFRNIVSAVNGALEFRRTVIFVSDMDHDLRKTDTLRMDFSFYTAKRAPISGHCNGSQCFCCCPIITPLMLFFSHYSCNTEKYFLLHCQEGRQSQKVITRGIYRACMWTQARAQISACTTRPPPCPASSRVFWAIHPCNWS